MEGAENVANEAEHQGKIGSKALESVRDGLTHGARRLNCVRLLEVH